MVATFSTLSSRIVTTTFRVLIVAEDLVALPHLYKAYDRRAFGRRLGGARLESGAAGRADE
ncbi:MAG TPA: hypothetical protein VHF70_00145 [Rubrobacteraceae bacterium]|nr:hypothetical protein [Rubrobacteraceae bacterium]